MADEGNGASTGASEMEDLDWLEANVTRMLSTAGAELLEEVYNEINLTIPPSAEGNANKLLRVLNRHLNSQTVVGELDEGKAVLKVVLAVLNKSTSVNTDPSSGENSPSPSLSTGSKDSTGGLLGKTVIKTESTVGTPLGKWVAPKPQVSSLGKPLENPNIGLDILRLKDCKIDGPVSGDKSIPLSSLEFQIANQRLLGHTDRAICAAVLRVMAQGKLKTYLELRKETLTIEFLLQTLKHNLSCEDSEALFLEMCNRTQQEGEKLGNFVTEVLVLRDQVLELRKAETTDSDRLFIQKAMLRTLSLGIRDNNIRLRLSAVLLNPSVTDGEIFKVVNEVFAHEKQRDEKLGLNSSASAQNVKVNSNVSSAASISQDNKKKRENVLQLDVQALKVKSDSQEKLIEDLRKENQRNFAELKSVLVGSRGESSAWINTNTHDFNHNWAGNRGESTASTMNRNTHDFNPNWAGTRGESSVSLMNMNTRDLDHNWRDPLPQQMPQQSRPPMNQNQNKPGTNKRIYKCEPCKQTNKYCTHCFKCGSDHHRAADCDYPPNLNEM